MNCICKLIEDYNWYDIKSVISQNKNKFQIFMVKIYNLIILEKLITHSIIKSFLRILIGTNSEQVFDSGIMGRARTTLALWAYGDYEAIIGLRGHHGTVIGLWVDGDHYGATLGLWGCGTIVGQPWDCGTMGRSGHYGATIGLWG